MKGEKKEWGFSKHRACQSQVKRVLQVGWEIYIVCYVHTHTHTSWRHEHQQNRALCEILWNVKSFLLLQLPLCLMCERVCVPFCFALVYIGQFHSSRCVFRLPFNHKSFRESSRFNSGMCVCVCSRLYVYNAYHCWLLRNSHSHFSHFPISLFSQNGD